MKIRRKHSPSARGLTLIEVVAGLALLATVIAAVLSAKSHWQRNLAAANRRLTATNSAEQLLDAWWQDPRAFPTESAGAVPGHVDLQWRTRLVNNPAVAQLGTRVVRLEIIPADTQDNSLLASVELVLPNPDDFHD